jgi:putative oxidoreductase
MSIFQAAREPWPRRALAIYRIAGGLLFITFGTMKLFGWPPAAPPGVVPVPWMSQMGVGGMLEVAGGAMIALGLLTRPVAFVLAGEMAVAYFQFHFPMGFWPETNNGAPAVLYCFFFLYLVVAGAGDWSLDAAILRFRRAESRDAWATELVPRAR